MLRGLRTRPRDEGVYGPDGDIVDGDGAFSDSDDECGSKYKKIC